MSLGDITLNSQVFTYYSHNGTTVTRKVIAPPAYMRNYFLEIAHTEPKNSKPDKHLVKISAEVVDPVDANLWRPMSVHMVFTIPKGIPDKDDYIGNAGCLLTDSLVDLVAGDSYNNSTAIASGAYL